MIINCPKCQYQILNTDTFMLLGHTADFWIELHTRAEILDVVHLVEEITRLKSRLYDFENLFKEFGLVVQK